MSRDPVMTGNSLLGSLPPELFEIAGIAGVAFYLGSYVALQLGVIRGSGYTYTFLNLAAASLVLISLFTKFNLWSAAIQVSWVAISIVGLTRRFILTKRARFNTEERSLMATWFPDLPVPDARRLLNAGTWLSIENGAQIAHQGQEIGFLFFLTNGSAEVTVGGKVVGISSAPGVIGEMTCFDGGPASATVTGCDNLRAFSIETGVLNTLCRKNADLRHHLTNRLAKDTHAKLVAANTAIHAR